MKFLLALALTMFSAASFADVPSPEERVSNHSRYMPLPNFPETLEFVRDGVENDPLMDQYLTPETKIWVKREKLTWLIVRQVFIDRATLQNSPSGVLIPVVLSFRYMKTKNWVEGTLYVKINLTENSTTYGSELIDSSVEGRDDSHVWEKLGRSVSWDIDLGKFVGDVTQDTLINFVKAQDALPHNGPGYLYTVANQITSAPTRMYKR